MGFIGCSFGIGHARGAKRIFRTVLIYGAVAILCHGYHLFSYFYCLQKSKAIYEKSNKAKDCFAFVLAAAFAKKRLRRGTAMLFGVLKKVCKQVLETNWMDTKIYV